MTDTQWIARTRRDYTERGLLGSLELGGRVAVVVVDLIRGFTDPACPPGCDLDDVLSRTARLLDQARAGGAPVFFTTIAFTDDDLRELVWLRKMPALKVLAEGSPWTQVDERLQRRPDEPVLPKKAASAFFGTRLADVLRGSAVDSLLVCGATTSGCVRATAIDACALNYPTAVVKECVGDRAGGPHAANLLDMDAKYADVISADEATPLLRAGVSAR